MASNPAQLLQAIAFAADKHRRQRRKDAEESPYINHVIAVATVLAVEGEVSDPVCAVNRAGYISDPHEARRGILDRLLAEIG